MQNKILEQINFNFGAVIAFLMVVCISLKRIRDVLKPYLVKMKIINSELIKNEKIGHLSESPLIVGVVTEWQPNDIEHAEEAWIFSNAYDWISENGVKIVPIFPWYTESQTTELLKYLDGVIFMGGMRELKIARDKNGDKQLEVGNFEKFSQNIIKNCKESNIAIIAICQGFQLLMSLEAKERILSDFANDRSAFTPDYFVSEEIVKKDSLFKHFTPQDLEDFQKEKVNYHFHRYGITPEDFNKYKSLSEEYVISSLGKDRNDKTFINKVYSKKYRFHGFQYHPERGNRTGTNADLGENKEKSRKVAELLFKGFIDNLKDRQSEKKPKYQVNDNLRKMLYESTTLAIERTKNSFYGLKGYTFTKNNYPCNLTVD